jgi:hypothetical protein
MWIMKKRRVLKYLLVAELFPPGDAIETGGPKILRNKK